MIASGPGESPTSSVNARADVAYTSSSVVAWARWLNAPANDKRPPVGPEVSAVCSMAPCVTPCACSQANPSSMLPMAWARSNSSMGYASSSGPGWITC